MYIIIYIYTCTCSRSEKRCLAWQKVVSEYIKVCDIGSFFVQFFPKIEMEDITDYLELTNLGISSMNGSNVIYYYHKNNTTVSRIESGFHLGDGRGWLLPSLGAHLPSLGLLEAATLPCATVTASPSLIPLNQNFAIP